MALKNTVQGFRIVHMKVNIFLNLVADAEKGNLCLGHKFPDFHFDQCSVAKYGRGR